MRSQIARAERVRLDWRPARPGIRPDPVPAFTVVAAIGLVISWIPDVALYAVGAPGTTVVGVLSLMSLHVVAAGLAVFLLGRYGLRPGTGKE